MTDTILPKDRAACRPLAGASINQEINAMSAHDVNRRAILAGAAATLPATALPAIATEPDPIFAVIRAYDEVWTALGVVCSNEPQDARGRPLFDTEAYDAWECEKDAISERLDALGLLGTIPTTLAGVRALVEYAKTKDFDLENLLEDDGPHGLEALSTTIVAAIDRIAAAASGSL
jgi:hypothetical protein